eukprot:7476715-Lingulodinium_polyedra.AAC.1
MDSASGRFPHGRPFSQPGIGQLVERPRAQPFATLPQRLPPRAKRLAGRDQERRGLACGCLNQP